MMWVNAVNTGLLDEWAKLQLQNCVENVPNCVDNVQNRVENVHNRVENVLNRVENVQNRVENVQNRVENVQIFWEDEPKLSVSASSWLQVEYSIVTNNKLKYTVFCLWQRPISQNTLFYFHLVADATFCPLENHNGFRSFQRSLIFFFFVFNSDEISHVLYCSYRADQGK